jgi:hypothetical protein
MSSRVLQKCYGGEAERLCTAVPGFAETRSAGGRVLFFPLNPAKDEMQIR